MKIVDFLIRNGADLRKWSRKNTHMRSPGWKRGRTTALTLASRHGHLDVMKMLIENGADLNQANKFNKIPLHDAILTDAGFESVKILIENGSNVNTRIGSNCFDSFEKGRAPLDLSCAKGLLKICALLLKNGANPNDGIPLIIACHASHFDVAALLLKHGLDDVNKYDHTDSTALQYVVFERGVRESHLCYATSNYKKNITRISRSYRAGKSLENQRLNAHLIV
jgi:ankyrin repeat protein